MWNYLDSPTFAKHVSNRWSGEHQRRGSAGKVTLCLRRLLRPLLVCPPNTYQRDHGSVTMTIQDILQTINISVASTWTHPFRSEQFRGSFNRWRVFSFPLKWCPTPTFREHIGMLSWAGCLKEGLFMESVLARCSGTQDPLPVFRQGIGENRRHCQDPKEA